MRKIRQRGGDRVGYDQPVHGNEEERRQRHADYAAPAETGVHYQHHAKQGSDAGVNAELLARRGVEIFAIVIERVVIGVQLEEFGQARPDRVGDIATGLYRPFGR